MFTITYYLAIENYPALDFIFPSFFNYILISSVIGAPLLILLGYIHIRRSSAYRSETEIVTESNPYFYKLPPGIQQEVFAPLLLDLITLLKKSPDSKLTPDEIEHINKLDEKINFLVKGGMFDIPKKFDDL